MGNNFQVLIPLTLGITVVALIAYGILEHNRGLAITMLGVGALLSAPHFRIHRPLPPAIAKPLGDDYPVLLARDDHEWQPTGLLLVPRGVLLVAFGLYFAFWG